MTPGQIILENEKPVLTVSGDHVVCTPVGGSHEDFGLTGRKIIFDTNDGILTVKHTVECGTIMNWTYVEKSGTAFPTIGTDLSGKNEYVSEQDDNRNAVPIADVESLPPA